MLNNEKNIKYPNLLFFLIKFYFFRDSMFIRERFNFKYSLKTLF